MCVVSMVGDHFNDHWDQWKKLFPYPGQQPYPQPNQDPISNPLKDLIPISRKEFEDLKKEVEIMKGLLKRAKLYDEQNNEPSCEIEEKMAFLRQIAKFVGIDLDDVIKKPSE